MPVYDALLIGHGLAGAVLAHTLARAGWRVLVLDQPAPDSASRVAAGLVNPLAGRRFALTWRADELLPAAATFYQSVEAELGTAPLWTNWPILKFFANEAEADVGRRKAAEPNPFIAEAFGPVDTPALSAPFGGLRLAGGGALQVGALLDALAAHRTARGELRPEAFAAARLVLPTAENKPVAYTLADGTAVQARYVIFCEGVGVRTNPWFQWLPVTPNTGEVLDVRLPAPEKDGPAPDTVLNGGVYIVPQTEPGHWRVGATYDWRLTPPTPTPEARAELLTKLARHVRAAAEIVGHRAAQRPAVRDRRPLLGAHPTYANLLLFNGFGSKGVGLAPGLAEHWLRVLTGAEPALWPEVNLARYAAFYSS